MNAWNKKCPGYGPDANRRKAATINHAPVAGEHGRSNTAHGVSALEGSPEVTLEISLEETSQGVEVEAEMAEGESPPLGGGVRPGEAGEALEWKVVTDVRETNEHSAIFGGTESKIIRRVRLTPKGNSPN